MPLICVGNIVAGGAGKTPTCLAVAALALDLGLRAHFLTRGYRGSLDGPIQVDPDRHSYREVGDEALLLARMAPCWVARHRPAGAAAAAMAGADIIIMDDGLQNLTLEPDVGLMAIDGGFGLGNGLLLPAGPLRETLDMARSRIDMAVLVGEDRTGVLAKLGDVPVLRAQLVPDITENLAGRRLLAFAGIGRPAKFFDTLISLGAELVETVAFADHHPYTPADLSRLRDWAQRRGAALITTEKDAVRLPDLDGISTLPVRLEWPAPAAEELRGRLRLLAAADRR